MSSTKIVNVKALEKILPIILPGEDLDVGYYSKDSNTFMQFSRKNGKRHYNFFINNFGANFSSGWSQEFSVNPTCTIVKELYENSPNRFVNTKYVKNCNQSNEYTPLNITGNIYFNKGESTTIGVSKGNSITRSTGETTSDITISDKGQYSVTVTDENGCTDVAADHVLEQFQDITQEGNRWNIALTRANSSGYYTTTSAIKVMGDSIVNDVLFKKLYKAEDALYPNWVFHTLFKQDSLGKVFFSQHITTPRYLYDFRLNPRETVYYQSGNAKVESIDKIKDLKEGERKVINISVSEADYSFSETWIEGIGSTKSLLNSISVYHNYSLLCFYQNGEVIYHPNPNKPCYINTITESKNIEYARNIKISPNPALNTFEISGITTNKIDQLELYSIDGMLIKSFLTTDNNNISNLSSGIYIVKIIIAGKSISKKLIIAR